jgi:HAD superfamily hydrolase (TIGR01509 family)
MGRLTIRPEELDAVTIDGFGTLLTLVDPIDELHALLPDRDPDEIERAFQVEADYYAAHSHVARDAPTLAQLRADCTRVFNEALGSNLTPDQYVGCLRFAILPGVEETLRFLRALGLSLAVVANWDYSLHEHLERHRLREAFDAVVVSAEVGGRKPDPAPFRAALEQLRAEPARTLHVGDHRPHDEVGALAAGMTFAPAPLPDVFAAWR